jgi:hypothetical protein
MSHAVALAPAGLLFVVQRIAEEIPQADVARQMGLSRHSRALACIPWAVMTTDLGYLPRLASREDFVDYLEGFVPPTATEVEQGKPARKLVKTYMLETARHGHPIPGLADILPGQVGLHRLDDTLYRVEDSTHGGNIVALLEVLDDRHPVLYTTLASDVSKRWVRQVVDHNPWLDRLWLSSHILFQLWEYVRRSTPSHRYVRLGFEHEAKYEASSDLSSLDFDALDGHDSITQEDDDGVDGVIERRKSKVMLTERLGVLEQELDALLDLYDPLHSLVRLQMPSGGRGGHMLYFDGQATNRSDSFAEHRATVALVLKLYRRITEHAEERLWVDPTSVGDDGLIRQGAPLTIRFGEPLSEPTFNRFVSLALERWTSRFRIGGFVTRRGPTKVHMAAIDRHLWQPLLLEVTSRQLLGVLPRGTCGNTIHRLVTNVQRYLDPNVEVWLGNESYRSAVSNSMMEAA